ncbi:MAG: hemolysin III family protein [Tenuifilaceae bacterium]|jgi:hemolysin III|nr:hemolysin III family protein [Bacteroidales bacterium]MDI9515883.1 hemolysin III family protein [Bacteroidota bacterium]NLH56132.1 hemolysin III family protein [Rikenellaceae bacterium]OQC62149.1 MAG: hemolysin-III related [Bacteroidetes bacterium ADurb.Bin008]HNV81579.1 hemolysin III family protein [Tenuifilaceae bacterium]
MGASEKQKLKRYEEIFNSTSHGVGVLIAIACTAIIVTRAALRGDAWHIVSYSIFGAGMIVLYSASTLFHGSRNVRKKIKLNIFDHSSIYILIAATYTPFTLVAIRSPLGWVLFGIIWGLAIAGIVYKVWFYSMKWRNLSTILYGAMGWMFIMAIVPIVRNLPTISLVFLLTGCLTYSLGIFFYIKHEIPFFHGIFHLFVLAGSICHFFALVFMV